MHHDEQIRILNLLKEGIANDTSADAGAVVRSPVADYTCRDLAAKEQKVFFRETPLVLGASSDLPTPGSYVATNEAGVPILMTRDDNGKFHAFLNVCRHRGVQVVAEGRGTQSRFSCPFHAWTYRNSGELIAVNRERKFGTVEKSDHGLVALPAHEQHGLLWVKPSPGGDFDVDELLGGLGPEMASWRVHEHEYVEQQVIDADINWKLAIDTFGENYHFDVLHRETLASDIHGNLQTSDAFGNNYRMAFANRRSFSYCVENLPQAQWPYRMMTLTVYFLYPNVIFLVDAVAIDILRIYPNPNDPAKSRTWHSYYIHPETRAYFEKEMATQGINDTDNPLANRFEGFNRVVVEEDYRTAASTQVGALSGAQTHYMFGRNEPALHHYHNAHRRGLGLPTLERIEG